MGWFWADNSSSSNASGQRQGRSNYDYARQLQEMEGQDKRRKEMGRRDGRAPHPMPRGNVEPPPECPMHDPTAARKSARVEAPQASACPYQPPPSTPSPSTPASSSSTPSYISKLNPLNYMPASIANTRETPHQTISLPLDREPSTIPRGDGTGTWEYPSPQQMYNAMLRKGYTDTPAEHVESMVAVHNFLNEGAWEEIKGWEARFSHGLAAGWDKCKRGEEGSARELMREAFRRKRQGEGEAEEPKLVRFMGRPNDPTPKARMLSFMAWAYPSAFPNNPPFDRHDWFVQRCAPGGSKREVRYVIDYYSGPPEPTGEPVFYLDVRPAVDGPTAVGERLVRWGGDVWWRASGGSVREGQGRVERARS